MLNFNKVPLDPDPNKICFRFKGLPLCGDPMNENTSIDVAIVDCKTCLDCLNSDGKILSEGEYNYFALCSTEDSYDHVFYQHRRDHIAKMIDDEEFKAIRRQYADYIKGKNHD